LILLEDIEDNMPDDREVQGREVFSCPAMILVKGYVQLPVKIVFDSPMSRGEDGGGVCWQ
jgi:hypothetical protein